MTHSGKARTLSVLVSILWVLLCFTESSKAESRKGASLQLRILLDKSELAAGSTNIEVDVELLNVSSKAVKFSPDGIAAQISIRNLPCSFKDDVRTSSLMADPIGGGRLGKLITLGAGETYRHRIVVHLTKDFSAPGVYAISMAFSGGVGGRGLSGTFLEDVDSNEALFSILEDVDSTKH